ncbi:hypothetical protein [Demequina oxidasica]|uniref:hypothetical protein n=1 Tax=Demequina oxidasica TaxID=676199 RepID=UPI000781C9CF|nr:hypothetical protein [Demequina oxidasica]
MSGYQRQAYDFDNEGVRFDLGHLEPVVVLFDEPRGLTWEATIDGDRLTSVSVSGRDLDQLAMRSMPLRKLRTTAAKYSRHIGEHMELEGSHLEDAHNEANARAEADIRSSAAPTPELFADAWRTTPKPGRRKALSEHFHVSLVTIDRWTRKARDQDLIDPPTTGRPRANTTQPLDARGTTSNEESDA